MLCVYVCSSTSENIIVPFQSESHRRILYLLFKSHIITRSVCVAHCLYKYHSVSLNENINE